MIRMIRNIRRWLLRDQEKRLTSAFRKVDEDIDVLRKWVSHLHKQSEEASKSHLTHVELTKKDINNISKWLNYFKGHNDRIRKHLFELTYVMKGLMASHSDLVDRVDSFEKMFRKEQAEEKAMQRTAGSVQFGTEPRTELRTEPVLKSAFEQKVIAQARSNRKAYAQNLIIETIRKRPMPTVALEKILVEEKQLCGRTTFYSYLKELRKRGILNDKTSSSGQVLVISS